MDGTQVQAARPFVIEDLLSYRLVRDLDLSRDGRRVVYEVQTADADSDQHSSSLWLADENGGSPRQLTFGSHINRAPRFSPDSSSIAFLSNREGTVQLYVLSLAGGEARRLTHLKGGAGEPVWSPDGNWLAFAAPLANDLPAHAPRVIRKATYKLDGLGYDVSIPTQLFKVSVGGGDATQLTQGEGAASQAAWSPDGNQLAYCLMRSGAFDSHRSDLWVTSSDGTDSRQLSQTPPVVQWPAWSPDGTSIAFYGSHNEGDAAQHLWLVSEAGEDERPLGGEDEEIASFPLGKTAPPLWDQDGKSILVVLAVAGMTVLARSSAGGGAAQPVLSGERQISLLAGSPSAQRLAFAWSDLHRCGHVSIADWQGGGEQELVDVNEEWSRNRVWPKASLRAFRVAAGEDNQGLLLLPPGCGPWPLLVDVHGGPHSYVELGFPYHPYWLVLASQGCAVLSLNTVGSASFGKELSERLRGHWGELDLPEHLAAIDQLVLEGLVRPEALAIAGKSYGGYLAAWAIGQTRRFRAAVCSAPVTNLESHFGTSDSGWYVDPRDMGAEMFEDSERYRRLSPIHHAAAATTPTLILQGADDQRCPIGQAEELFATLMRARNAEVELVVYPGGTHRLAELGRPSHRLDYHGRIAEFVLRHVQARG